MAHPIWYYHVVTAQQALEVMLQPNFSKRAAKAVHPLLPYCLHPVAVGSNLLVWLNRDYKPLGMGRVDTATLAHYPDHSHLHVARDAPAIQTLLRECSASEGRYYLFASDATINAAFGKRLLALLRLVRPA